MDFPAIGWHNWKQLVETMDSCSMELEDFQKLYPSLSREQLARIAGCSVSTVNNWFVQSGKKKVCQPTEGQKLRFALFHWLRNEPSVFKDLRSVVEELKPETNEKL